MPLTCVCRPFPPCCNFLHRDTEVQLTGLLRPSLRGYQGTSVKRHLLAAWVYRKCTWTLDYNAQLIKYLSHLVGCACRVQFSSRLECQRMTSSMTCLIERTTWPEPEVFSFTRTNARNVFRFTLLVSSTQNVHTLKSGLLHLNTEAAMSSSRSRAAFVLCIPFNLRALLARNQFSGVSSSNKWDS